MDTFFNNSHLKVVHIALTLSNFVVNKKHTPLVDELLDVDVPLTGYRHVMTDIRVEADCRPRKAFTPCEFLQINFVNGPGSSLGYDYENSAGTWNIDGYYQVGRIACQTGACSVDLIPVEPPN
jgi:hypothetical protein